MDSGKLSTAVKALPHGLRIKISQFYNWNEVLLSVFREEIRRSIFKMGWMHPTDDVVFRLMIERVSWWLHLIKEEGYGSCLSEEKVLVTKMKGFGLNNLVEIYLDILNYNRAFKSSPIKLNNNE